jgi:hypothetical protein
VVLADDLERVAASALARAVHLAERALPYNFVQLVLPERNLLVEEQVQERPPVGRNQLGRDGVVGGRAGVGHQVQRDHAVLLGGLARAAPAAADKAADLLQHY